MRVAEILTAELSRCAQEIQNRWSLSTIRPRHLQMCDEPTDPPKAAHIDLESTFSLIERARAGDKQALERLFARHLERWATGRLPKWARDLADTDDLVQDTLLRTFKKIESFEPRRVGALQAYLRNAVLNRLRDELRRKGCEPESTNLDSIEVEAEDSPLEAAISPLGEDGSVGPGILVPEFSSPARDTRIFIRKDGLEAFITSNRAGSLGAPPLPLDIWVSTRATLFDPWSVPTNLGNQVNSTVDDVAPWLSKDGTTLYFSSNRPGSVSVLRDIWYTTRMKLND